MMFQSYFHLLLLLLLLLIVNLKCVHCSPLTLKNKTSSAASSSSSSSSKLNIKNYQTLTWKKNLNYQQMKLFIEKELFEKYKYLSLITIKTIGKSVYGNELIVIRISTDQQINLKCNNKSINKSLKPTVKFIGTIHGNEPLGKQLLLALAEYLIHSYHNGDERIQRLLNSTNIELLPLANPDGFSMAIEDDCTGISRPKHRSTGRENAKHVDLDNDFALLNDEEHLKNDKMYEQETLSIMTWMVENPSFVLSASIHTGLKAIVYPYYGWDVNLKNPKQTESESKKQKQQPDDLLYKTIAKTYLDSMNEEDRKEFLKKCFIDDLDVLNNGIIDGYHFTPENNQHTMSLFNYINTNCIEFEFYLSCCKYSNSTFIELEFNKNKESFIKFIETAHWGIKGQIIDSQTNLPIEIGMISIDSFKHNITSLIDGKYWRLLLPGIYNITINAIGYEQQTRQIKINNNNDHCSAMIENFKLKPIKNEMKLLNNNNNKSNLLELEKEDIENSLPEFRTPTIFKHHNYIEMENFLKQLHNNYSHITRLYSIGKSVENRELYVLEISDNPGIHELLEPEFKYVANMHGNEVVGREMVLLFAKLMLENYGHHPLVDRIINNTRIHLMASMNPDGYERSNLGDCYSLVGRWNAHNVDLNRNFPDQYRTTDENRVQQPETVHMMRWLQQYPFVLSANLHGGALVANYPFDGSSNFLKESDRNPTPDDQLFRHLASVYAQNHPHMHKGVCYKKCFDFRDHFENGIVNGASWYSLYGGMQDWNYLHTNCFEITVELGCQKFPNASELPRLWQENRRPMLIFIQEVHKGIKGVVRDSHTNSSIVDALIKVNTSTHPVRSVYPFGDFWRLLLPGHYELTVTKLGYETFKKNITIPKEFNATAVHIDVILQRSSNYETILKINEDDNGIFWFLIIVIILSLIFFTFCMSIIWCPNTLIDLLQHIQLCNYIFDWRILKMGPTRTRRHHNDNTPNTFYYSKLNVDDNVNNINNGHININGTIGRNIDHHFDETDSESDEMTMFTK